MGRFTNPRDLYFGEGARHEVKNLKGKKAVIVSGGHSMRRGGFLQDVQKDLEDAGFEVKLFEGVESDPSIETVQKGAKFMQDFGPDWIRCHRRRLAYRRREGHVGLLRVSRREVR